MISPKQSDHCQHQKKSIHKISSVRMSDMGYHSKPWKSCHKLWNCIVAYSTYGLHHRWLTVLHLPLNGANANDFLLINQTMMFILTRQVCKPISNTYRKPKGNGNETCIRWHQVLHSWPRPLIPLRVSASHFHCSLFSHLFHNHLENIKPWETQS